MTVPAFNKDSAKLVHFYHLAEHAYQPPTEPLPVSFIPPNAYWTSADKSAFFQSLARHSRWRPDLISDEIGNGKSVVDVCSYIGLLEQGLREAPSTSRSRNTLPIAREVSDDWLHAEESIAQVLQEEEGEWEKSTLKRKRAEEMKLVKTALQVDKGEDAQEDDHATITPGLILQASDSEDMSWQERLKKRKEDFAALWKREDLLSSLNGRYLKAMESMVRASEEAETESRLGGLKEIYQPPLQTSAVQISPVPPPSDIIHPAAASTTGPNPLNQSTFDHSQIDPTLIALDMQSTIRPMQPHDAPVRALQFTVNADSGPSGSQPNLQPLLRSSPSRASSHDSDPLDHIRDLSPVSRRRIRKRLWMRRKRALQSGLSVSEVSIDTRKLKPGRKGKLDSRKGKAKVNLPDGSEGEQASQDGRTDAPRDQDEGDDSDNSDSVQRKKPYGWTKLESLGVDGPFLRKAGLDLFRLSNFSGFTSLINDINRRPEATNDGEDVEVSTLSSSFLLMLRAYLTYFIIRVIGQTLTQKRIDTQQKKRVRKGAHAGRSLKIKAKNVHEALKIMGHSETKKRFFRRLKDRIRDTTDVVDEDMSRKSKRGLDDAASTSSETESNSGSETDDETDVSEDQSSDSDHDPASQPHLPHTFIPQSEFQQVWNLIGDRGDGTRVLGDLDDNAVLKELEADDVVDKRDQEADRELENFLWEEIGVQRDFLSEHPRREAEAGPSEPKTAKAVLGDKPPKDARSIRFRKPGGVIKSSVFIEDSSDEDGWEGQGQ